MKRELVAGLLFVTLPLVVANAASATPAKTTAGCKDPVPQRSYEDNQLTYRLAVDYSGCGWWHGGPITLDAGLSRLDGQGEVGSDSLAMCASPMGEPPPPDGAGTEPARPEAAGPGGGSDVEAPSLAGTCDVTVGLEHPAVEAALYRGQATYPWAGVDRTVGFSAFCGPTVGCVDLPADPGPVLSAARHLVDPNGN